jgi:hypothetical protein
VCFIWISEQTANFALHVVRRSVFIREVESVYSAVRTESLYNTDSFVFKVRKSGQQFVKVTFLNISITDNVRITNKPEKVNVYLPSLMMKVPDHLYVLGDTYTCHT